MTRILAIIAIIAMLAWLYSCAATPPPVTASLSPIPATSPAVQALPATIAQAHTDAGQLANDIYGEIQLHLSPDLDQLLTMTGPLTMPGITAGIRTAQADAKVIADTKPRFDDLNARLGIATGTTQEAQRENDGLRTAATARDAANAALTVENGKLTAKLKAAADAKAAEDASWAHWIRNILAGLSALMIAAGVGVVVLGVYTGAVRMIAIGACAIVAGIGSGTIAVYMSELFEIGLWTIAIGFTGIIVYLVVEFVVKHKSATAITAQLATATSDLADASANVIAHAKAALPASLHGVVDGLGADITTAQVEAMKIVDRQSRHTDDKGAA